MPLLDRPPRLLRAARRTLAAALAAAATAAAGCGGDSDGGVNAAGTYQLVAFDGNPLPFTLGGDATTRVDLTGGGLDLRSDRTFSINLNFEDTNLATGAVGAESQQFSGRYTTRGSVITLADTDDTDGDGRGDLDGLTGRVDGTTVTLEELTFRR